MAYPSTERVELPLLQELAATGGSEHVRFLYDRLVAYFPQLDASEVRAVTNGHRRQWRRLVQRAGRALDERREIERDRGRWRITERGRRRVSEEAIEFSLSEPSTREEARVVVERLVEVADAEEEYRVGVAALDVEVLLAYGRGRRHRSMKFARTASTEVRAR